jgi:hypothetical protein
MVKEFKKFTLPLAVKGDRRYDLVIARFDSNRWVCQ